MSDPIEQAVTDAMEAAGPEAPSEARDNQQDIDAVQAAAGAGPETVDQAFAELERKANVRDGEKAPEAPSAEPTPATPAAFAAADRLLGNPEAYADYVQS